MCTFSVQKWKALIDVIVSFVVEFLAWGWHDDTSYLDESNQRNELLHQLDSQEQGIEDDRTIRENLDINADSGKRGNDECILQ